MLLSAVGEAVGVALDLEPTLERIAGLTVPSFADTCLVYLVEGASRLRVAAVAADDPEAAARLALLRAEAVDLARDDVPVARVARSGQPEWLEDITTESIERAMPDARRPSAAAPMLSGSIIVSPLAGRSDLLGAIVFGRSQGGRRFSDSDIPLALEVGRRTASAVESARLYAEAQRARETHRLLAEASEALGATLEYQATVDRIVRLALPHFADWCALYLRDEAGALELAGAAHADRDKHALLDHLSRRPDGGTGGGRPDNTAEVVRTGRTRIERRRKRTGAVGEPGGQATELGAHDLITVPLRASGRVLGAMTFALSESGRELDADAIVFAEALGDRAASALDRVRLFREARDAGRTLKLLADVSSLFSEVGFDVGVALERLSALVGAGLGGACSIFLADPGARTLRLASSWHRAPDVAAELRRTLEEHPPPVDSGLAGRVVTGRQSVRIAVESNVIKTHIAAEHRPFLDRHPISCYLAVPMVGADAVFGAISLVRFAKVDVAAPFTAADELLLSDIAHRAALALLRMREHQALRSERQRLDAVVRQMPSAVAIIEAPSGRVLLSNAQNHRIFRLPAQTVTSLRQYAGFRALHPDGRPLALEEWPAVRSLQRGEIISGEELHIVRGDGSHGYVRVNSAPVRDDAGEIVAVVVTYDDVTEHRRASDQLALLARVGEELTATLDYEETLARVVDLALPSLGDFGFFDVVEEWDAAGQPARVRRIARAPGDERRGDILRGTGWVRSERTDMNLCALSSGHAGLHPNIDDAWLTKVAVSPGHLAVMRDLGFTSMITVPLRYESRVLGALTLFRIDAGRSFAEADVTFAEQVASRAAAAIENARLYRDLLAKEAAVSQALVTAKEAERRKDEFLAMLGHELRNPLAPILTALELMRLRAPEACRDERQIIERQAGHLTRLVDDLLDVSRIASGKTELRREPAELADAIDRAVETVGLLLRQRRHRLQVLVRRGLIVEGDPHRLTQIFANLLANAARYTEPDGAITVRAVETDGQAVITVEDSGVGISAELLPHVFDLFVQGTRQLDRSDGGLGLGLSIVRSLVTLHGGTVTAASEGPGRGSRFTVTLPLGAARAAPPFEAPADRGEPTADAPRRVLVVDDNRDAAATLGEFLEEIGYRVEIAFDAAGALEAAARFRPDVAVLDIGLPVMTGYELAERLRRQQSAPPVLIALTGYGQKSDRDRATEAGFAAHLVKPVELERLSRTIEALTRG